MSQSYYTLKSNPEVARIVDNKTSKVVATVGVQPKTSKDEDWNYQGEASFAKAQESVSKEFAEFRKPDTKAQANTHAKRLYDAVIKAGNSEETARQVSGYVGK